MTRPSPTRRPKLSEEGYILVWVIFLVAILSIAMSVAVPRVVRDIQLDRERETMKRGMQYRRAIQLYYRKFHAYPPNVDALVKTNEIRFLRKKYVDLITGKDDWKPVRFGQNKTPTAMGFFGQPLAGSASTIAGTGPSSGNGLNGSPSLFAPTGTAPGAGSSATAPGAAGATPGIGGSSTGSTDTGLTGQTFGGAGIIGFSPASSKSSIMIYKKKNHYNEWEFVYDPLSDMRTITGNTGAIGQPVGNTATPVGTPTPPAPQPPPQPAPQ
jgi:type II secretory pathway pseudopilin PulG